MLSRTAGPGRPADLCVEEIDLVGWHKAYVCENYNIPVPLSADSECNDDIHVSAESARVCAYALSDKSKSALLPVPIKPYFKI